MVGSCLVNHREGGTAGNAVGVVLYVWEWIHIPDGPSVKGSKISTGLSLPFGTRWRADDYGSSARLTVPSRSMASNSVLATAKRSDATRLRWQATGGPVVVHMCFVVFAGPRSGSLLSWLDPGNPPWGCLFPCLQRRFTLGDDSGAMITGVDSDVNRQAGGCSCIRRRVHSVREGPPQSWIGPRPYHETRREFAA